MKKWHLVGSNGAEAGAGAILGLAPQNGRHLGRIEVGF